MRIDRRLVLIGVMLVVLSMTMATQYATTKVTYSFSIVHPSEADIRFIGSDNSSTDNLRCLRISNNATGSKFMTLELGDFFPNTEKNYTAAFGIVNEEQFPVNITYINISGINSSYVDLWVHGDRDADYTADGAASVMAVDSGVAQYTANDVIWTLAAGDGDTTTINGAAENTHWDPTANIQYSISDTDAVNETDDYVWVGISLNIPEDAGDAAAATGTIFIHFKSSTIT